MTSPLIEAIATIVEDRTGCCDGTATAQAALTAITEAGMVIVPREPTQDMISAGIIERHEQPTPEAWSLATSNIYRAMITAALPIDSEKGE